MESRDRIAQSRRCLAALGKVETRTQFGGYSLSVEKRVFAVVSEGELYLRACEETQPWFRERKMTPLIFRKRGVPVQLNYYQVDEYLWQQPDTLLALSRLSLNGLKKEALQRQRNRQIKDLPNMGLKMAQRLSEVGINTIDALRELGAKRSWLRLHQSNPQLGINTLLALQGAISGQHRAALPGEVVSELTQWYQQAIAAPRRPGLHESPPGP
ncbi:TfoX/Sxy family DNA transformation protein [Pantoea sp. 1.19]|uniref:TfoX/Sxy family DNA transformation protein n=1 Tax=Pantoea sp. 1.19 TaxID=1925589 RepID=UPI000948FB0E|nr:TfoX/Sxy family DNA transformation protein [Pantoea sp. 1.19]